MMIFIGAVVIAGLTAYVILSFNQPPQPVHDQVTPPQDNTPFVGKKW